jgi:hypothetical protein
MPSTIIYVRIHDWYDDLDDDKNDDCDYNSPFEDPSWLPIFNAVALAIM